MNQIVDTKSSKDRAKDSQGGGGSGIKSVHTTTRTTTTTTSSGSSISGFGPQYLSRYGLGLFLCLVVASYGFVRDVVVDSGLLLGAIQPLNTAGCEPIVLESTGKPLQSCEDVHIHYGSGLVFTACGNAEARKTWLPAVGMFNVSVGPEGVQDELVVYDIATGVARAMELVGFPANVDRVFHGMDFFQESSGKQTTLTIFLINHRRTGSVVEVLEYTLGVDSNKVRYVKTIEHDLIQTPNDILAMGPRSFYVTNDHFYKNGTMRIVEETLRRPWSSVLSVSPTKTVIAYAGIVSANGITSNRDRSQIYVSACHGAALHVLRPNHPGLHPDARFAPDAVVETPPPLVSEHYVKLDFYSDNPSFDPATGSILLAGHVQPFRLLTGLNTPEKPIQGPSRVVQVSLNKDRKHRMQVSTKGISWGFDESDRYKVKKVLEDDGQKISTATSAVVDRMRGVMFVGTVLSDRGLWRCPIPQDD
ncbi:hypothetical protein EDD21DRAFT_227674 [Dissophora ornata]|nr:hypothetical protein BGZ58_008228 [Dissophora ornata]KAI8597088.1 hypothetical protein EDD21DRAFT_227674 [Dissophora ornata]